MSDPLSIAASIIALLQLTSTVTQYLKDASGGSEDRIRLLDEVRGTVCLLEMLKDRVDDVSIRDTWLDTMRSLDVRHGPLSQFKEALERLIQKLVPSGRMRQVAQTFKWPFDKSEIIEILGKIERLKALFGLALQNDQMCEVSREYSGTGSLCTASFPRQLGVTCSS